MVKHRDIRNDIRKVGGFEYIRITYVTKYQHGITCNKVTGIVFGYKYILVGIERGELSVAGLEGIDVFIDNDIYLGTLCLRLFSMLVLYDLHSESCHTYARAYRVEVGI